MNVPWVSDSIRLTWTYLSELFISNIILIENMEMIARFDSSPL